MFRQWAGVIADNGSVTGTSCSHSHLHSSADDIEQRPVYNIKIRTGFPPNILASIHKAGNKQGKGAAETPSTIKSKKPSTDSSSNNNDPNKTKTKNKVIILPRVRVAPPKKPPQNGEKFKKPADVKLPKVMGKWKNRSLPIRTRKGKTNGGMGDPRTSIPTFTPEAADKPTKAVQTNVSAGSAEDPDMAYNNFYQRLLSGGSAQMEQTHMVGQSLSPHRFADPGPPTSARPGTNAERPGTNAGRPGTGLAPPGTAQSRAVGPNVYPYAGPPPGTAGGVGSVKQEPLPKKVVAFNVPPFPMQDNQTEDPGEPVVRAGRLGAPWRHVRQCTGNGGNHICFIDGMVKEKDMNQYPPYGYASPRPVVLDHSAGSRHLSAPMPPMARSMPAGTTRYNNSFNNHAKSGFKYWFEEKKGLPGAKQTIGGRLMKMGVGY